MRRLGIALGLLAAAAACKVTPDYERPALEVPQDYIEPAPDGESIANLPWWEIFQDETLQELIKGSLEGNKDLGVALARITEARELVTVTRADQLPFLDVLSSSGRGRQSQILVPGASTRDTYALAADLSFEVDLWGRLRRATEAARADLFATEAAYRNVTISLIASVASFYFLLRDLDSRLAISRRTVVSRADSLEIIRARFDKGIVPELDVNQAEIELSDAEAAAAFFEREVIQAQNALRILLGENPGPIERGLTLEAQSLPPELPTGVPAELLRRRPDVATAEERLVAETALVGVAEALRYPSISLRGTFGLIAEEIADFDKSEAQDWSIAANVIGPIFNSGQLKAQADAQRARSEQALYDFEATLQQAFREVEDALVAVRTFRAEHAARERQMVAARNAARLSRARYDGGVVDYLEVLDSERSLFNAELDESLARQQTLNAIVQLYKALGGGWTEPTAANLTAP